MPEIKNQFTGGKMNKDLDERLVPKGEYRDAMNIQVSTSDGSNVGVVQNILGNTLGCANYSTGYNPIPSNSFTVGSVADEKNDTLYWLLSGQSYNAGNMVENNTWSGDAVVMSDFIFRKNESTCSPVFVDIYAFSQPNLSTSTDGVLTGVALSVMNQLQIGWTVTGVTDSGDVSNEATIIGLGDTQDSYIGVEFVSETSIAATTTTSFVGYSQYAVGSGIWIPAFPLPAGAGGNSGYSQQNSNFIYINGFNGVPGDLIGDTIEILPYGVASQTFEIINAETVSIVYANGLGTNVVKVTLNSNLANFTGLDQPSTGAEGASPNPYISTYNNGYIIDALIGSVDDIGIEIATGELIVSDDVVVTSDWVGDVVYMDNIAYTVSTVDVANNSITLVDVNGDIHAGWQVGGMMYGIPQFTGGTILMQQSLEVSLDTDLNLAGAYTSLLYRGPRTLNFNHNKYITGINIVDDMLLWTDGVTEPKKINIPRSVRGSTQNVNVGPDGSFHTRLINESQGITVWDEVMAREEHITVIKKAPLLAPSTKFTTQVFRTGDISGSNVLFEENFAGKTIGQITNLFASDNNGTYGFEVGDTIRLASDQLDLEGSYDVRVEVIEINTTIGGYSYITKILFINPNIGSSGTIESYYGELEDTREVLFERKLPRFAYRYRYLDNEYSSFSPFTDVAFIPGGFNYDPIQAYNIGMSNTIKTLSITDFVTPDIPKDVKSIDLLYKNETSPVIYLIDTVANNDAVVSGENSWNSIGTHDITQLPFYGSGNSGSYNITNENIARALPSNQSLRSWDNVPKRALAQEISGNRIIYGNYTQGYNIENDSGQKIAPNVSTTVVSNAVSTGENEGSKSIKSLRNYEVGVVWGDKYGRETPVVASTSGSVLVPKSKSKTSNHLKVSLDSSPGWSDYYRFYVKETSNEYYNIAVDRIYDADDGNIWVSFPSVDRNKIDEETYLILKKGVESEELVEEKGRYKVVAIENEAPDYIKTSFDLVARTNQDLSRPRHSCNLWGGLNESFLGANDGCTIYPQDGALNPPVVGRKSFSISRSSWINPYDTTDKRMGLPDLVPLFEEITGNAETLNNEMYVSFTKEEEDNNGVTSVISGDKYHVTDIEIIDFGGSGNGNRYIIHLEKPIGLKDEFVVQDTGQGGFSLTEDGIHVLFWQKSVTNKPEFDGRFFVKILNDATAQANLSKQSTALNQWVIAADVPVYKLSDTALANTSDPTFDFSDNSIAVTTTATYDETDSDFGTLNEQSEWGDALEFGGSSKRSRWFIDNAPFAGLFNSQTEEYTTSFQLDGGNTYYSCDSSSEVGLMWSWMGSTYTLSNLPVLVSGSLTGIDEDCGTGKSFGRVGMKGIHTASNGKHYIDLSYSQLTPDTSPKTTGTWDIGVKATNTSMDDQKSVTDRLILNSRFKLVGGEGIFVITGITKRRLLNYMGAPTVLEAGNPDMIASIGGLVRNASLIQQEEQLKDPVNKRFSYRIKYKLDVYASPEGTTIQSLSDETGVDDITNQVHGGIQFLTEFNYEGENKISSNPAVFETEPKEDVGLDLYYEASSSFPVFPLNNTNKYLFIPTGTTIVPPYNTTFPDGIFVTDWKIITPGSARIVKLSMPISEAEYTTLYGDGGFIEFLRDDGTYVTATLDVAPGDVYATQYQLSIIPRNEFGLSWHNCWSFNNGVESNRIGDTFNKPHLSNGVTLSTTVKDSPGEENRNYGLIYSGIYNSNSGLNNLNQFIAAEKITKDINPTYGSIQKLHSGWGKSGSLMVLCEDRVLNILANKDALFNADGNTNITSTNNVLGATSPYAGKYGISKNPESFASESYRVYFTDKVRGAVIRLSQDGLTPISEAGMKDWFRDNLKLNQFLIGSFDDRKKEYNITLKQTNNPSIYTGGTTVSFKEDVKGWVSFKSFTPECAISCANQYYTFNQGKVWKHHSETEVNSSTEVNRNTFYKDHPSDGFTPSSLNVIINESPSVIKTFHTLGYEGTQSKVNVFTNYDTYIPGTSVVSGSVYNEDYYNLEPKLGWKVQSIITDQEEGSVNEFIEKEGKWFNYIRGKVGSITELNNPSLITGGFDNTDIAFQGLGVISQYPTVSNSIGCTGNGSNANAAGVVNDYFSDGLTAYNYNPFAMIDDGNCVQAILGCTDVTAVGTNGDGFNSLANVDDGSCIYYGCTDATALNYLVTATSDNGSCTYPVFGCTDGATDINGGFVMSNFNVLATEDCVTGVGCTSTPYANCCCIATVYGCMDPMASNYDSSANTQAVSFIDPNSPCFYEVLGCTIPSSCDYYPNANTDDGSCTYCNDALANNYDGVTASCDSGCQYCASITNITLHSGFSGSDTDTIIAVEFYETWSGNAPVDYYEITYTGGGVTNVISNIQPSIGLVTHQLTNLTPATQYVITIEAICSAGTSLLNPSYSTTSGASATATLSTAATVVNGCTDAAACNYDANANTDDGSCEYVSCGGCTDAIATNYDPTATINDGSCIYVSGCTDPSALNYDVTATLEDNSCTYPVPGCMDDSLANDGTTAATNYDAAATVDDGSCIYVMPALWTGIPPGNTSAILNTPGWKATGLWSGGTYRRIYAIWDVSSSPKLINSSPEYAWQNSFGLYSTGDISNFTPNLQFWKYSNDDGANWLDGNAWNGTDPIQLIYMQQSESGKVQFVDYETNYPPHVTNGDQLQKAKFTFANAVIPAYETPIAIYSVSLGCNDSGNNPATGAPWLNYNGDISFYDNNVCSDVPGTIPDSWGGYDLLLQYVSVANIVSTLYFQTHQVTINYNPTASYVNVGPIAFLVSVGSSTGDQVPTSWDGTWETFSPGSNPQFPTQSTLIVEPDAAYGNFDQQTNFSIVVPINNTVTGQPSAATWTHYRVRPILSFGSVTNTYSGSGGLYNNPSVVYGTDMEFWLNYVSPFGGTSSNPNADPTTPTL